MKYLLLEENINRIITGYDDTIHKNIPKNAIKVKEDIWQERLNNPALNCFENEKLIIKDFRTVKEIEKEDIQIKIKEAQYLLDSTQFKFGDDYDKKNTPEWEDLKLKRAEARNFIRDNK